jgi:hypothetical protein
MEIGNQKSKRMCMTKTNPSSGLVPDAAAATATQAPLDLYSNAMNHTIYSAGTEAQMHEPNYAVVATHRQS